MAWEKAIDRTGLCDSSPLLKYCFSATLRDILEHQVLTKDKKKVYAKPQQHKEIAEIEERTGDC